MGKACHNFVSIRRLYRLMVIRTRPPTKEYLDNWDEIFKKKDSEGYGDAAQVSQLGRGEQETQAAGQSMQESQSGPMRHKNDG